MNARSERIDSQVLNLKERLHMLVNTGLVQDRSMSQCVASAYSKVVMRDFMTCNFVVKYICQRHSFKNKFPIIVLCDFLIDTCCFRFVFQCNFHHNQGRLHDHMYINVYIYN